MNSIRLKLMFLGCSAFLSASYGWGIAPELNAQTVVESLDTHTVELLPRWQIEPKFDFSWEAKNRPPKRQPNLEALNSSVVAERVEEARWLVVISQRDDVQGGEEALALLLQRLKTPVKDRMELLAYLSGAMSLASEESAPEIWAAAQSDAVAQLAVERWLIEIGSNLALPTWRQRLANATEQNEPFLTAVEGVGVVGEASDVQAIQEVVSSDSSYLPTKLVAASALGDLASEGLESFASSLLESESPMRELLAARSLAGHTSPKAGEVCERILASDQLESHGPAFRVLINVDAEKARITAKNGLLKHPESPVRQLAVEHLANLDDADALRALGFALRDSNPRTRRMVRAALYRAYSNDPSVRQFVLEALGFYLKGDFPFGAEQAIVLAVALDQKQFCPQLVNLLRHPMENVHVRAAWAIQELTDDDRILDRLMPLVQEITEELETSEDRADFDRVTLLSMLFGAFGRNAYMPANEILLKYIPKNDHIMRDESRAAAIWALGHIWVGSGNADVARQLVKRMRDNSETDPENKIVKYNSALALGMIRDPASRRELQAASAEEPIPAPLGFAATWALEQYDAPE